MICVCIVLKDCAYLWMHYSFWGSWNFLVASFGRVYEASQDGTRVEGSGDLP